MPGVRWGAIAGGWAILDRLTAPERGSPVVDRLLSPARRASPAELLTVWDTAMVQVVVDRPDGHDDRMALLNRLRGAWGRALMQGASDEAIAGKPCPWSPPCALDVFFREQLRDGRHAVPKPYVLSCDVLRRAVVFRLTVFGFACEWLAAAADRFVQAVRQVRWQDGSSGEARIRSAETGKLGGFPQAPVPDAVVLEFDTPFDGTGMSVLDQPSTLVARAARRVDGMARWMDCRVDADWETMAAAWSQLEFDASDLVADRARRGSARQRREMENPVFRGCVAIAGELAPVWPLLLLAQTTHIGRGAVSGYGRFQLTDI